MGLGHLARHGPRRDDPARAQGREYARHTYAEALFYLKHTDRLTAGQREWLLGRTAATVLGWG